jgi:hypothetical protein
VAGVENSDVEILLAAQESAAAKRVVHDASGRVLAVHPQPRQCVHHADAADIEVRVETFTL